MLIQCITFQNNSPHVCRFQPEFDKDKYAVGSVPAAYPT